MRLAIVTTHPIQYYAPIFKLLSKRGKIAIKVFYTWGESGFTNKFDPGFGKIIEWDVPLLDGYEYEFLENIANDKGSHHFNGIVNPDIINTIEKWKADAVLVIGWNFRSHLKVMRYFKKKIPVFFRGDSTLLDEKPGSFLKNIIRKVILTWVYKHVDKALYVGTNNKLYYKKFGLRESQLICAPHAIDNERFTSNIDEYKKHAAEWRKGLNISSDAIVFLFVGKLESKKDPLLLLNAFNEAKIGNSNLIFVGNGELEHELKQKASANKKVHFIDFQNQKNIPVIYYMSDVLILPSKGPGETWGLALNEAMACGKPVIASDKCGGAADLIKNGNNGYIFKAGDEQNLSDKLKMISDKQKIVKMGLEGYNKIKQFNFIKIAEAIECNL
jgi:glycosyltransferase involved in cell wall biosynthesis